jgi:hypothetical protein
MGELLRCQPIVNSFADVHQCFGLFTNIMHAGHSFRQKNKSRGTQT